MSSTRRKARATPSKHGTMVAARKRKRVKAKPSIVSEPFAEEGQSAKALALSAPASAKQRRALTRPVTREWVLERLAENVRRAMQIEPVTLRGQPTGEFRHEGSVANRALELLGKELGLFVEKSESVNTHHVISGEPISEAKWEERYAKAR